MPLAWLVEMTLPAPEAVPPIVTVASPKISIPSPVLPRAWVPVMSVPIRLPWMTTPPASNKLAMMPVPPFPEITLPAPAAVPPIVTLETVSRPIAGAVLALPSDSASDPLASVPSRFPWIVMSVGFTAAWRFEVKLKSQKFRSPKTRCRTPPSSRRS